MVDEVEAEVVELLATVDVEAVAEEEVMVESVELLDIEAVKEAVEAVVDVADIVPDTVEFTNRAEESAILASGASYL